MTPGEKRLLAAYRRLEEVQKKTLEEFAEFLLSRTTPEEVIPTQPLPIARPAEESVIKAIRRLTATYPMLDSKLFFHEVSRLMSLHVMHGRPSREVIDELEALFARFYEQHRQQG
jgi:hypothetical protein